MATPGFRVEGRVRTAPFQPRTVYSGYQAFHHQGASGAVLVEPGVARGLREAASRSAVKETGGLLAGRTRQDDHGPYVLVCGFVEAPPDAGSAATFRITPRQTAALQQELAVTCPAADMIGWWHSHPAPSRYSPVDLDQQRVFGQQDSVGLLVFATGEPWGRAYLGAGAEDLGGPAEDLGSPASDQGSPARRAALPAAAAHARPRKGAWTVPVVAVVAAAVVVLIIAQLLSNWYLSPRASSPQQAVTSAMAASDQRISQLTNQVNGLRGQVSALLARSTPTASSGTAANSSTPVTMQCNRMSYGRYQCAATGPDGDALWLVNGGEAQEGRHITLLLQQTELVQLNIVTAQGVIYAAVPKSLSP